MVISHHRCIHSKRGQKCPTSNCSILLPIESATAAWGLGSYNELDPASYSYRPSYFGSLVQSLKYRTITSDEYASGLEKIERHLNTFVTEMFDSPADSISFIPGNRPNRKSLPENLVNFIRRSNPALQLLQIEKIAPINILKTVDVEKRAAEVQGKYKLSATANIGKSKNILLIDDVYQTGASLSEVARVLARSAPNSNVYAVAITYLRDPKVKP
jgi:hypothetical protein